MRINYVVFLIALTLSITGHAMRPAQPENRQMSGFLPRVWSIFSPRLPHHEPTTMPLVAIERTHQEELDEKAKKAWDELNSPVPREDQSEDNLFGINVQDQRRQNVIFLRLLGADLSMSSSSHISEAERIQHGQLAEVYNTQRNCVCTDSVRELVQKQTGFEKTRLKARLVTDPTNLNGLHVLAVLFDHPQLLEAFNKSMQDMTPLPTDLLSLIVEYTAPEIT